MKQQLQLDEIYATYHGGKESGHRPGILPCSNTQVRWVAKSNNPFGMPSPKLGLVNLRLLHLRGWCSTDVFTFSHLAVDPQKDTSCPITSTCRVRRRNSTSAHASARDFEPPVSLSDFRPYYSATTVCFIYLFIHLFILFPMSLSITLHHDLE